MASLHCWLRFFYQYLPFLEGFETAKTQFCPIDENKIVLMRLVEFSLLCSDEVDCAGLMHAGFSAKGAGKAWLGPARLRRLLLKCVVPWKPRLCIEFTCLAVFEGSATNSISLQFKFFQIIAEYFSLLSRIDCPSILGLYLTFRSHFYFGFLDWRRFVWYGWFAI